MTNSTTPSTPKKQSAKQRKRYAKFGLAVVGLVGVTGALTSAAWTDEVWFAADTSAATVDLQGSATGAVGSWFDIHGDDETSAGTPIQVGADEFENLLPGDSRTVTVHLRNAGSVDIALGETPVYDFTGDFDGALVAADVDETFGTTTLAAGDDTTLEVTIDVPADWDESNMGATGTLLITVTGTGTDS